MANKDPSLNTDENREGLAPSAQFLIASSYVIFGLVELIFITQAVELGRFHFPSDSLMVACAYQLDLLVALVSFTRLVRSRTNSRAKESSRNLSDIYLPTLTISLLSAMLMFQSITAAVNHLNQTALK